MHSRWLRTSTRRFGSARDARRRARRHADPAHGGRAAAADVARAIAVGVPVLRAGVRLPNARITGLADGSGSYRASPVHQHLTRLDGVESIYVVVVRGSGSEPCHAPRGRLPERRLNLPFCRHCLERMKGLEPSTFCMARTWREATGAARNRHSPPLWRVSVDPGASKRQQPTRRPDREPDRARSLVAAGWECPR
jgi:hypothetical protein